ncbi:unnamed protein product [Moneuplotes crassus]|uniref:E3 ubiquitin-protein ligase CHFR n=1 Tax=Euplotes crassus TaxID=5936 RepID=A0AAD1X8V9_EUPCR|nr:unnamed protein product [Moneuplotes crassus]
MSKALAKFTSLHDDTAKDFSITDIDVTIGRKKVCGHRIANTKISGVHCQVQLDKETGVFTIIDKSTNGTFVNDKRIGKDEPSTLHNGDKVYLLNDENEDEKIGFIFVATYEKPSSKVGKKRKRNQMEGSEEEKESNTNKKAKKKNNSAAVQQMKCSFCLEIMYKPVCLIPCLHNFCGGCYADWMVKNGNCPECRDKVKSIKRNHLINSMIDAHLKENPDQTKNDDTKLVQDDSDCFTNAVVTITAAKKLKKEHDKKIAEEKKKRKKTPNKSLKKSKEENKEESKEENKKEEEKKEESKGRARAFRPKCKNCEKSINGFQCDENTRHVVCTACKVAFPLTGKPGIQPQCICCKNYFCHQHWPCRRQTTNKVSSLETFPFVGIPQDALSKNSYEQTVLKDFVRGNRFTNIQFKNDIFTRMEADQNWDITDALGVKQTLRKNSSICRTCFPNIWQQAIYWYRNSITAILPNNVQARADCWYGHECRTQIHKYAHAAKLNHICQPKR